MYHAFGLNIQSEIDLPELLTSESEATDGLRLASCSADVDVRFGSVPSQIEAQDSGICFQAAPSRMLINLPDVARFDIRDGREIVIDRADGVCDSTLRLFVLGYCMGALLHQRQKLVLHAAVVARDDHCLAFAGVSSAGKSTLAAALIQRGYNLVADEIGVIDVGPDKMPRVLPGYPALLLWKRSLKKLNLDIEPMGPVRPEIEKFVVPVHGSFLDTPQRLTHLYVLNSWNQEDVELKAAEGFGRFNAFLNHTYRERYLKGMGLARNRQQQVAAVVPHVKVQHLSWPQSWDDMDRAIEVVEEDLNESSLIEKIPHQAAIAA
jgi:hypothetical protein